VGDAVGTVVGVVADVGVGVGVGDSVGVGESESVGVAEEVASAGVDVTADGAGTDVWAQPATNPNVTKAEMARFETTRTIETGPPPRGRGQQ